MAARVPVPTKHRKIGTYKILGELGRGGMALVYHGAHELLGREVAIKELLPTSAADTETQSRFRREALALANFRHQNIVTLYDLVEKNDSHFMVMEYVDGPTLQELIKEGPLPPEIAAIIGAKIASALEHAHFRRIIHRDLKPANVMITKTGEVKLMDFGIARDESLDALTQEGMAVGTPAYMAPEQVVGQECDARTDVFALGVLLYETLSGERAFSGKNAGEVFARVREGQFLPLKKRSPKVPDPLARVVQLAMRTRRTERYQDAAALRRDLEAWLSANVDVAHAALLMAFLRSRNRISESEAQAHLGPKDLELSLQFTAPRKPRRWKRAFATLFLLGAGGSALWVSARYPELLQQIGLP